MNMPNSSYAIDSAWFSLRKRDEKDDYDLTPTMSEEDQKAAARYIASMSPEKQAILQRISDTFHAMPPDAKGQLTGSAHRLLQQYEGRLGDVLPQLPNADGGVAKFVPLVIGAVFALDALNQSQGAQGSLVGNVFTSIGNTISGSAGGDPNLFGETNYDDIFEYENQSSLVNPITGQSHAVVDNPSFWERTWMGAASTAGTFLNPFAVAGAGVRGTGRVAARAGEGAQRLAGRATQKVGEGISRLSGVAGRTRSEQLLSKPNIASRFTDAAGRGVSGAGAKRIARSLQQGAGVLDVTVKSIVWLAEERERTFLTERYKALDVHRLVKKELMLFILCWAEPLSVKYQTIALTLAEGMEEVVMLEHTVL
jgi:hypothetical protein